MEVLSWTNCQMLIFAGKLAMTSLCILNMHIWQRTLLAGFARVRVCAV
jgi:hypothetical protein